MLIREATVYLLEDNHILLQNWVITPLSISTDNQLGLNQQQTDYTSNPTVANNLSFLVKQE